MLKISNLEVNYGKMQVIKGISLEVKEGELISVIGPNGAGKTTLIRTIMGLKKAASGSIFFEDKDITALPAWKRADMGIGYVPEGRRVFGNLTVEENLLTGCYKVKDQYQTRL